MMTIDLNNPLVKAMLLRTEKFEDEQTAIETIVAACPGGVDDAVKIATYFVANYTGTFSYIHNVKRDVEKFGEVPRKKLKGVLNVLRAEAIAQKSGRTLSASRFQSKGNSSAPKTPAFDTGLDISSLAKGDYHPIHNSGTIVVHVEKPGPNSKWSGWVFLTGGTDPATYGATAKLAQPRIGSQRPGETLKLTIADDGLRESVLDWITDVVGANQPIPPAAVQPPAPPAPTPNVTGPAEPPAPAPAPKPPTTPVVSIRDQVKKRYNL